jgi:hypothetical protein
VTEVTQLERNNRNAVYIAAASAELRRYEAAVALAESLGLFVVGKWGAEIVQHGSQGLDLEEADRRTRSRAIRTAIAQCRGFIFLQPPQNVATRGGFWECGFAEGLGGGRRRDGSLWPLWSFHVSLTEDTPSGPPISLRVREDYRVETVANLHPHRDFILVGEDFWAFHANDAAAVAACAQELHTGSASTWDAWLLNADPHGPPTLERVGGRTFEAAWWSAFELMGHDRFTLKHRGRF